MFDMNSINDMAKQFSDKLPPEAKKFKKELDKNFRVVLESLFTKLNLVTREEFDVQKGVLKKARTKITSLEKNIKELGKYLPKVKAKKISK